MLQIYLTILFIFEVQYWIRDRHIVKEILMSGSGPMLVTL